MEHPTALDSILRYAPPVNSAGAGAGDDNSTEHARTGPKPPVAVPRIPEIASSNEQVEYTAIPQTDDVSPSILCRIGYFILRTFFYLAVLAILATAGFYVAKLVGYYDPCTEYYYTSDVKCSVTSYMKGVVHHINCFEEQYCILPGFWSNTSRQSWSLTNPVEFVEAESQSTKILPPIMESSTSSLKPEMLNSLLTESSI